MKLHEHLATAFGHGKEFNFHGTFKSKAKAVKRESEVKGAFILERGDRYLVVTRKGE